MGVSVTNSAGGGGGGVEDSMWSYLQEGICKAVGETAESLCAWKYWPLNTGL